MNKHLPPVSIEQLAAYLDGNLSQSEMQQITEFADHDEALKHLLDANAAIEETLSSYSDTNILLPDEIANMDFDLPTISDTLQPLVTLSPEPFHFDSVAAATSIDNIDLENNSEDHFNSTGGATDESIGSLPDMSGSESLLQNPDDGL